MPDISMCTAHSCPMKEQCYRYTATPSPMWQTYADFSPDENGECDYFYQNETYKEEEI
jgi:hypothetical protein